MKSLKHLFDFPVYLLAVGTLRLLGIFPRPAAYAMTERLARWFLWVLPMHRKTILTNLGIAMPELSREKAQEIALGTFSNIGRVAIELGRLPRLRGKTRQAVSELFVLPPDVEARIRSLLARGKGLLYLTGHFGVWELLPNVHATILRDIPLSIVVRPLDNPWIDRLVNGYRSCLGNRLIPKKNSLRLITGALGRNEAVGILLDQNVCWEEGVFVDFFGKLACTNFGLAALALRTGSPVLPVGLFYDAQEKLYRVHAEPEISILRTGKKAEDIRANTALFAKATEAMVRQHPDQWLWVHKRWKTRPKGSGERMY